MKVIWHQGGWNRNFGDWAIFDSVHHHLTRCADGPVSFVPVDGHATRYSAELVARLNAEADMLLLGSGGLIFHRPEDHSHSGWQFNITLEDLAKIEVPLVIYGIGYNRFAYDPQPFPELLDAHLRAVQNKAALFSVRNTGTQAELIRRGLDPTRIRIVPDAGIFAPCRRPELPRCLRAGHKLIGVNLAGDRPEHRYPAPADRNERLCTETLATALKMVCDELNARVLLIPHIVGVDERRHAAIAEIVGRQRVHNLRDVAPHLYAPGAVTAALFVGVYDQCDLVVGERGHACLIAFGRRVPLFALGSHRKTRFLLEDLGLQKAELRPEEIVAGRLAPTDIGAALLKSLSDGGARAAALEAALTQQQQRFTQLNQDVVEILFAARPTTATAGPVRALVLDFDGVLTDDKVLVHETGTESVRCSRSDSLALSRLTSRGVPVVVISREENDVVPARCRKLGIECHRGVDDKLALLCRLATERAVPLAEICYVGNDLPDLDCLRAVGFGVAVADAHPAVRRAADFTTARPGGDGAVREVVDLLIDTGRITPEPSRFLQLESAALPVEVPVS